MSTILLLFCNIFYCFSSSNLFSLSVWKIFKISLCISTLADNEISFNILFASSSENDFLFNKLSNPCLDNPIFSAILFFLIPDAYIAFLTKSASSWFVFIAIFSPSQYKIRKLYHALRIFSSTSLFTFQGTPKSFWDIWEKNPWNAFWNRIYSKLHGWV